jgi:hypothetical protein
MAHTDLCPGRWPGSTITVHLGPEKHFMRGAARPRLVRTAALPLTFAEPPAPWSEKDRSAGPGAPLPPSLGPLGDEARVRPASERTTSGARARPVEIRLRRRR